MNDLYVVGIGPGGQDQMTAQAVCALEACQVLVGYTRYIDLVSRFKPGRRVVSTGMHGEVERCREAVALTAAGDDVALISSGDAGVYGMAGLVLEIVHAEELADLVAVTVVPGVTAATSAAALLGAPLMHDFVVISLSDWLTEWSLIEKRIHCAGSGDFVTVIYNPRSRSRPDLMEEARRILLQYKAADTPVGLVRNAYRDGQQVTVTTLSALDAGSVDMLTTVIVGNRSSYIAGDQIITPRGYGL